MDVLDRFPSGGTMVMKWRKAEVKVVHDMEVRRTQDKLAMVRKGAERGTCIL